MKKANRRPISSKAAAEIAIYAAKRDKRTPWVHLSTVIDPAWAKAEKASEKREQH